jgi:hypothetical protein
MATSVSGVLSSFYVRESPKSPLRLATPSEVKAMVDSGLPVQAPVLEGGNFAFRGIESVLVEAITPKTVKSFVTAGRTSLSVTSSLLAASESYGVTETHVDGSIWIKAISLKDGLRLLVACPPTGNRVFNLQPLPVSKAKQEKPRNDVTTYTIRLNSSAANLVLSTGVVFF